MFVKWKEYDDSYRGWLEKSKVFFSLFLFLSFFLHITKVSQIFPNLSNKRRTNIQLKRNLASFANKTYVKEPTGIEKKLLIWCLLELKLIS